MPRHIGGVVINELGWRLAFRVEVVGGKHAFMFDPIGLALVLHVDARSSGVSIQRLAEHISTLIRLVIPLLRCRSPYECPLSNHSLVVERQWRLVSYLELSERYLIG
jgi:hypothetical protein